MVSDNTLGSSRLEVLPGAVSVQNSSVTNPMPTSAGVNVSVGGSSGMQCTECLPFFVHLWLSPIAVSAVYYLSLPTRLAGRERGAGRRRVCDHCNLA